jgi:hypothetical protein
MAQPKRQQKLHAADAPPVEAEQSPDAWTPPAPLSRRGWIALTVVVLLANAPVIHGVFRGTVLPSVIKVSQPATEQIPFMDDFSDPSTVQKRYWATGGLWRVVNGWLFAPGVKNNPLWLKAKLPRNVAVEFDVRSESPEGDIKVEIFGDGLNHASGYVLVHGGWNNSVSIIARLDEHGRSLASLQQDARRIARESGLPQAGLVETGVWKPDTRMRVEANPFPVQMGRPYHWRIERTGTVIKWSIDGQPFMELNDPFPLEGENHNRFAFANWESMLYFDNLKITPL